MKGDVFMIRIHIDKPDKLKNNILVKKSAFVSFDYNPEIVSFIKKMGTRIYNPDNHTWEIPINNIISLCNKFENEEIRISGIYEDLHKQEFEIDIPKDYIFKTKPFNHQIDGVRFGLNKKKFLLCDDQGLGKALALDTKIYTPDGYKCMRDIQVGDYVFNKSGLPTKVTATYSHKNVEMYRITFSDGCHIDCCKDHLWEINSQHGRKKVIDTKWLTSKDQFGKYRNENLFSGGSYKFWIDRCNPVQFNKKEVLIDPYVLGCLLGDGNVSEGSISFTSKDFEIINEINNRLPQGYFLHSSDSMTDIDFNIVKKDTKSYKENIVKTEMKNLGLYGTNSHTKFIPDCY